MGKEVFLLDANILINPKRTYYPFDFAPGFWVQLEKHIESGNIAILDMVIDEIKRGGDDLSEWIDTIKIPQLVSHKDKAIISKYAKVIQNVQSNPCYNNLALNTWSGTVADPWLIAAAAVNGYTLVTMEISNKKNLSSKNQTGKVKIPDVADDFNVETIDLFSMMRKLNFVLK